MFFNGDIYHVIIPVYEHGRTKGQAYGLNCSVLGMCSLEV